MTTNKRLRGRGAPRDGRNAPSPLFPRCLVIPAKAGTYWGASVRESGNLPLRRACRREEGTYWRRLSAAPSPAVIGRGGRTP